MDTRRIPAHFIPLALAVVLAVLYVSDEVSSEPSIFALDPYGEAVAVSNPGPGAVDLKGLTLSDGEGAWTFSQSLRIPEGGRLAFSLEKGGSPFDGRVEVVPVGEKGVVKGKGSFRLGNAGDDVYLKRGERILDAVCYGSKAIDDRSVWTGPPAGIKKGYYLVRTGGDTDSAADWTLRRPGVTETGFDPDRRYDAEVTPFLFPDSGGAPVYEALEAAERTVRVSMYLLSSRNVYALLCELEDRGVDVTLLLEGSPLGVDIAAYVPLMRSLEDHGGEVLLIGGTSDDRFTYAHAKYAVVDGRKVVITTENWTSENMNGGIRPCSYGDDIGNRGWGAVVDSPGYASFMEDVFRNDSKRDYGDVRRFSDEFPNARPANGLFYDPPDRAGWASYGAKVVPFLSPDGSFEAEAHYMDSAKDRVYSEQQSIGSSFRDAEEGSPLWNMAQAVARGVDARLVIEASSAGSYAYALCASTGIKAASMESPYVHNKGLVCDDVAIVATVNWTDNSFSSNRECGVAIESEEVSGYFAEAFLADHRRNYLYEGFEVEITEFSPVYRAGDEAVFSVMVTVDGDYLYSWDLGDGRTRATTVPRMSFWTTEGEHTLSVTVSDDGGNTRTVSASYSVLGPGPMTVLGVPLEALAAMLAFVAGAAFFVVPGLLRRRGDG